MSEEAIMSNLTVNEILNRDAKELVTQSDRILAEDKRLFLLSQAQRLYDESHRIDDTHVYIQRDSISTWIENNLRLTVLVGAPCVLLTLLSIIS
jgi:hypothetical protein